MIHILARRLRNVPAEKVLVALEKRWPNRKFELNEHDGLGSWYITVETPDVDYDPEPMRAFAAGAVAVLEL